MPAGPVALTQLTLTAFRNYSRVRLDAGADPVVLTGPNGSGKTNILEAISLLAPGRGLRRASLGEITRRDAAPGTGWAVAATLSDGETSWALGTGLAGQDGDGRPRRLTRIDGRTVKSRAALAELLAVSWLTPQQDGLFTGPAEERRRFLDRLVAASHSDHVRQLAAYEQALRQRARLLRAAHQAGQRGDPAWLNALEARMAAHGVAVAATRRRYAEALAPHLAETDGRFPAPAVTLTGTVEGWLAASPAVAVEEALAGALAASRDRDATAGGAADGPHRSDFAVTMAADGRPAATCSTGEQKGLLLALVLGDARLKAAARASPPILLLDEVAAHLDPDRRAALIRRILDLGAQAWLTGTEPGLFAALAGEARFFHVAHGSVERTREP